MKSAAQMQIHYKANSDMFKTETRFSSGNSIVHSVGHFSTWRLFQGASASSAWWRAPSAAGRSTAQSFPVRHRSMFLSAAIRLYSSSPLCLHMGLDWCLMPTIIINFIYLAACFIIYNVCNHCTMDNNLSSSCTRRSMFLYCTSYNTNHFISILQHLFCNTFNYLP